MKLLITCLSTTLFLCATLAQVNAKVYHWVDAKGVSHFSDIAPLGAKEVSVKNENLVPAPSTQAEAAPQVIPKDKQELVKYQAEITSPTDDMAIRSNNGTLNINVKITPEKNSDQLLQLFLDGVAFGKPQVSTTIRALNIDRGTHQLQVQLLGSEGKILTKTQIVTVHLQRTVIN